MKTVVICEKPNVASKVGKVVHGPGIEVVSARGHLLECAFVEKKGAWTYPLQWRNESKVFDELKFLPIENSSNVLGIIANACRDADVLVSATDLDREGSSIFLEIYTYLRDVYGAKFDPELKRMELSSLTDAEIKQAWANLKEFDWGRSRSGITRNIQDMLWGISLTRGLTIASHRAQGTKSGGRVQTPMLGIIVERDREIEHFIPKTYYTISLTAQHPEGQVSMTYDGKLNSLEAAQKVLAAVTPGATGKAGVTEKDQKTPPPPPFNGTGLQIEGNRVLGFSAKEIADRSNGLAQSLYSKALLSYPGTDSEKYPADWATKDWAAFLQLCNKLVGPVDHPKAKAIEGSHEDAAHPCLRPVGVPEPGDLSKKEAALFDLITRRCAAGFCEPAVDAMKKIKAKINGYPFVASGKTCTKKGWREVYPFSATKDKFLPDVKDGDSLTVKSIDSEKKETSPPVRYNAVSLIAECDKLGLGTKNTRPSIIEKLEERNYIAGLDSGKKRVLTATDQGKTVIDVLNKHVPIVTSVELTTMFNSAMDNIEKNADSFEAENQVLITRLSEIMTKFKDNEEAIGTEIVGVAGLGATGKCPNCGKKMRIRSAKGYTFLGCEGYPQCRTSYFLRDGETPHSKMKCKCGMPILMGTIKDDRRGELPYIRCIDDKCDKTPMRCVGCKGAITVIRSKAGKVLALCEQCRTFNAFTCVVE